MKASIAFFILILLFCRVGFSQEIITPDTTLVYKNTPQGTLSMDAFLPSDMKTKLNKPAIVFFFGGGWSGGSTKQFYSQAKYFAEKGFLAFSAQYRIKSIHHTTPFECVEDAKSAVRWIRAHADSLGIDPQKIIASGGSAGGHIAACTAFISGFETENENLSISSVPNALVLFNPVVDTSEKGLGMSLVGENRKTEVSPVHHIKPNSVPTIIFHGTDDKTVPFENVERFTQLMKASNNICDLVGFPGKGHGFFNSQYFKPKLPEENYNAIIKQTFIFLKTQNLDH